MDSVAEHLVEAVANKVKRELTVGNFFAGQDLETTSQNFTNVHEAASAIYYGAGDIDTAFRHLMAYERLHDERTEFAASANSALLGAQFDFAEQELEIEQLRTEGLMQDLALTQARERQRLIAAAGIIVLIAGLLIIQPFE